MLHQEGQSSPLVLGVFPGQNSPATNSVDPAVPVARLVLICEIDVHATAPNLRVWPQTGYWRTWKGERDTVKNVKSYTQTHTHTQKEKDNKSLSYKINQSNACLNEVKLKSIVQHL